MAIALLAIGVGSALYALLGSPLPGVSIAIVGAAAAVLSLRLEMKPFERAGWCLVVACLSSAEVHAIRRDRYENDKEQAQLRSEQNQEFSQIAKRLENQIDTNREQFSTTMAGLTETLGTTKAVLNQTEQTIRNTTPYADVKFDGLSGALMLGGGAEPISLNPNMPIGTNIYYHNSGSAAANNVRVSFHLYIGTPDNRETQIQLQHRFNAEWVNYAKQIASLAPNEKPSFATFFQTFSQADFDAIRSGKTIYRMFRAEYLDATGKWDSDDCGGYQNPLSTGLAISHRCTSLTLKRHHPTRH